MEKNQREKIEKIDGFEIRKENSKKDIKREKFMKNKINNLKIVIKVLFDYIVNEWIHIIIYKLIFFKKL